MPQRIEVPGMGIVEFPDGMNDEAIAAAIKQNMPQRSVMDKLTGIGGERVQTWPERAVRGIGQSIASAATLPGDVLKGGASLPSSGAVPGSTEFGGPDSAGGRVADLAMLGTPVSPAARIGERVVAGEAKNLVAEKAKVPTTEELAKAGAADITAAKDSGLEITSSVLGDFSRKIQRDLFDRGIHPVDAEKAYAKLKELESAPADSFVTASNLQSLRESLGHTAQNFNPNAAKDQLAATLAIKELDKLLPSIAEKDVLAGSPAATAKLSERGRGNYAAGSRSNDITGALDRANTGILERAEVRAQASNSGRNIDNTIRQKVASALEKPKEVSGFSDAELEALNGVIAGGAGRNTARAIGNLLGGGGGWGQFGVGAAGVGTGAAFGGPVGAAVGAIPAVAGIGAKAIANALAKRELRKADELIRKRSPLYKERAENPAMRGDVQDMRALIARMLLDQQQ
jgi:hypothetical protein